MKNFSSVFKLFVLMRLISAIFNPIDDCDEVFNFYEPVSLKKQINKQNIIGDEIRIFLF